MPAVQKTGTAVTEELGGAQHDRILWRVQEREPVL
jgi:hypothetical protein